MKSKHTNLLHQRWQNVLSIWNNQHYDDVGLEKILRLVLATTQFIFPGLYIKQLCQLEKMRTREAITDTFVFAKMCFPVVVVYMGWYHQWWAYCLVLWFMIETLLYVPTLIFASDLFNPPRSYRRTMLLVFVNYFEIVFDFSVLYASGNYLNLQLTHWYDPIYFSFATSSNLGFGDLYPITPMGKFIVSFQSVIFLVYVVLFISIISNKFEHVGYFNKANRG